MQEHEGHTRVFTLILGTQMCLGIQYLPSKCTRGIIICGKLGLTESSTSFEVLSSFLSCNGFLFKMHMVLLWINEVTAVFVWFPFQTLMDDWQLPPSALPSILSPTQPQPFPSFSYPCSGGNPGQSHRTHRKSNFAKLNSDVGNAPLLPPLFR